MSSLTDIKELIEKKSINITILEFSGWYLKTNIGIFTLIGDQYYKNGTPISKKEIEELLK